MALDVEARVRAAAAPVGVAAVVAGARLYVDCGSFDDARGAGMLTVRARDDSTAPAASVAAFFGSVYGWP
jgi:hypothetical protein